MTTCIGNSCSPGYRGGGRVVRWCWVNFQCWGVLLIWIRVGQGLTTLAVGAGGGCLDIFSLVYHFSLLSPSLWEKARYRLKYCLKGPLIPKQPTNQPTRLSLVVSLMASFCAVLFPHLMSCMRSGTSLSQFQFRRDFLPNLPISTFHISRHWKL